MTIEEVKNPLLDYSVIKPRFMQESENEETTILLMTKILLERIIVRKELKMIRLQEQLLEKTQKLIEAERKIQELEATSSRCSCSNPTWNWNFLRTAMKNFFNQFYNENGSIFFTTSKRPSRSNRRSQP